MYRQLQAHASSFNRDGFAGGSIRQSFCAALSAELTEFYHLIAVLQEQTVEDPNAISAAGLFTSVVENS